MGRGGWGRLTGAAVEEEAGVSGWSHICRRRERCSGNILIARFTCGGRSFGSGDLNELAVLSRLPAQDLPSSSPQVPSCLLLSVVDPGQAAWILFFFFF